ncbi:MAG: hypothetical protein K2H82_04755 [Oscillospiraceae bacterium]|nr:hypothetical protein [Oscillospiraceae bacterium]
MYNSQEIAKRIKIKAKEKKITINQLLLACGLGKNTIVKMGNGTDILSQNLAKIADYLEISVDYLLGRKDTPEITGGIHISSGDGGVSSMGDDANITVSNGIANGIDATTEEFAKVFSRLNLDDKFEVMQLLMQKKNGK